MVRHHRRNAQLLRVEVRRRAVLERDPSSRATRLLHPDHQAADVFVGDLDGNASQLARHRTRRRFSHLRRDEISTGNDTGDCELRAGDLPARPRTAVSFYFPQHESGRLHRLTRRIEHGAADRECRTPLQDDIDPLRIGLGERHCPRVLFAGRRMTGLDEPS